MAALHEEFLHIAGPTDVLTFPLEHNDAGDVTDGEVVVCLDEAERRAAAEQVAWQDELLLYAVHGLLHLVGFDDRTRRDFDAMHQKEDEILTAIGIGPVFRRTRPSTPRPTRRAAKRSRTR